MIVAEGKPGVDALAAFVTMQVGLTNPIHDARADAGQFSYAYLSLPALLEHIAKPRREAGLAVAQEVGGDAGTVTVTTYLIHLGGGWLAFGPAAFPAPADPQKRGAVISYARRYALLAALGLAAEDDDAASATVPQTTATQTGKAERGAETVEGGAEPDPSPGPSTAPLPSPDDIAATQRYYHPKKAHDMIVSPHAPGMEICTRNGCTFNKRKAA